jgi:predicted DNA binding protein
MRRVLKLPDNRPRKLTSEQVIAIRIAYRTRKTTMQALADKYNVTKQTIFLVVRRRTWKHL